MVVVDAAAGEFVLAAFDAELEQPAASIPAATSNTPSDLNDTVPPTVVRGVYEGADTGVFIRPWVRARCSELRASSQSSARSTDATTDRAESPAAFVRASRVAGARQVSLTPSNGAEVARVVLLPDGTGYLKNDGLARLDADHTYQ